MTNFVLDTSVAMSWLFKDEETEYGVQVLGKLGEGCTAFVPNLFFLEVANVLLIGLKRSRLNDEDIAKFLDFLKILPIKVFTQTEVEPIVILGKKHKLSSYDACYLSVALKFSIPIATFDKNLQQAALTEGVGIYNGDKINK